jgi:hypothetical protein
MKQGDPRFCPVNLYEKKVVVRSGPIGKLLEKLQVPQALILRCFLPNLT